MIAALVPALAQLRCQHGEGALWHARRERLYWVDIAGQAVYAYEPVGGRTFTALVGEAVSTVVPTRRPEVLVALQRRFAFLDLQTARLAPFPAAPLLPVDHRFNDGKCDSAGRLWVGSMAVAARPGEGALWRLESDLRAEPWRDGLTIPNGIVWSRDGGTVYHIDSTTRRVDAFDFEPAAGAFSRRRTVREFSERDGFPDGMSIDSEGHLWIAMWDGWRVVRIDSTAGTILDEIPLPVASPTSCAFGGANLDTLYITTARNELSAAALATQPLAGAMFECRPGVVGVPACEFGS